MSNVQKEILLLTFHRGNQVTNFKIKNQSILKKKKAECITLPSFKLY